MEILNTYGAHFRESSPDTTITPQMLELEEKIKSLGFSPVRTGGFNETYPTVNALAITLKNGHPLFLNLQNSYANRQKGYINFSLIMPANMRQCFIVTAKKASQLTEPKNCGVKTLTAKKLNAIVDYYSGILRAAILEANAGRALLAEWRERLKNSGFNVYESSVKAQGLDNLNVEVDSPARSFRLTISASSDHAFVRQLISYNGGFSWDQFLKLAAFDEEKSWFCVDFTGLNFVHHGFLIFGSLRAVNLWCSENEKIIGACGFIVNKRAEGATSGLIINDVYKRKVLAI